MTKQRPYRKYTTAKLKKVVDDNIMNNQVLGNIYYELTFRKTPGAVMLQKRMTNLLKQKKKPAESKQKINLSTALSKLTAAKLKKVGLMTSYGYRVGLKGEPKSIRKDILDFIYENDLPKIVNQTYMNSWGEKKSAKRLSKLVNSISAFKHNAKKNSSGDYSAAIKDWEDDLKYLKKRYAKDGYKFDFSINEDDNFEDDIIVTPQIKNKKSIKDQVLPGYDLLMSLIEDEKINYSKLGFDPNTNSELNRFVMRMRLAQNIEKIKISGYATKDTPAGYEALIKSFVLWTTFETYLDRILGGIQIYQFAESVPKDRIKKMYDHYRDLDQDWLLWEFFYEQTPNENARRCLDFLKRGAEENIFYFGRSIRNMFAHGYLTANTQGIKAKKFKLFLDEFFDFLLEAIKVDFKRRINEATIQ